MSIASIINSIIKVEGGYVNHPSDRGGPTNHGITLATLGRYLKRTVNLEDIRTLNKKVAYDIYYDMYVKQPKFDVVHTYSNDIAAELVDSGVLSGPTTPIKWLQTALNAFNLKGTLYPDIAVDGVIGPRTISVLQDYLIKRGKFAESVMLKALNAQQGAFFLKITADREANEDFTFGWFVHRIN
jgi:lysozyme family protein